MRLSPAVLFLLVCGVSLSQVSCDRAQTAALPPVDTTVLVALVHDYGHDYHSARTLPMQQPSGNPDVNATNGDQEEAQYQSEIAADLVQKDFDQLDKVAREARATKARFSGGVWKLFTFYEALSDPIVGDEATDADWTLHIENLKAWSAAHPQSAAARIALAETYIKFSYKARGSGYASTVSESGWKLQAERTALAVGA
jgi:hypothetical protein